MGEQPDHVSFVSSLSVILINSFTVASVPGFLLPRFRDIISQPPLLKLIQRSTPLRASISVYPIQGPIKSFWKTRKVG
jgi:hypothetical protein